MWKLSAPGCAAEGSFLRIQQEEYYGEEKAQPDPLEFMPDVCPILRLFDHTTLSMTSQVQSATARLTRSPKGRARDFFPNYHHRCPSLSELSAVSPLNCRCLRHAGNSSAYRSAGGRWRISFHRYRGWPYTTRRDYSLCRTRGAYAGRGGRQGSVLDAWTNGAPSCTVGPIWKNDQY